MIDGIILPDGAEPLTIAWWHNRNIEQCDGKKTACALGHCLRCGTSKWVKTISFSGSYEEFAPAGKIAPKPRWEARGHHPARNRQKAWEGDENGHQLAIVLGREYGYFVPDIDIPELYKSDALLAKFITRADAMSTRGDHWHALVWVPPELRHLWPDKNIPGADIKGSGDGFVPVPGAYHYSGAQYEPVPGARAVVATEALLLAIRTQPVTERARAAGYTGGAANGRQGDLQRGLMRLPFPSTTEEAGREWWLAEYDRLEATKDHIIDPDPEGLFIRQWKWRQKKLAADALKSDAQFAWAAQSGTGGNGSMEAEDGAPVDAESARSARSLPANVRRYVQVNPDGSFVVIIPDTHDAWARFHAAGPFAGRYKHVPESAVLVGRHGVGRVQRRQT